MKELKMNTSRKLSLSHIRMTVLCPKCDVEMNHTTLVGIEVEKCPSCEGLFFDKGETEKLVNRKIRYQRWKRLLGINFV